jgi:hypothetical protein
MLFSLWRETANRSILPSFLLYRSVCHARHVINGAALNSFHVSFLEKGPSNFSSFPFGASTFLDAVALYEEYR